MKILFNNIGKSTNYLQNVELLYSNYNLFREKHFSKQCLSILQPIFEPSKLFLTHSATGALEMIALMMDFKPGDEVIIPSFTFVSSANAFVSHGATPVFVDIDPINLNIDLDEVEKAITPNTKAVVAVHYAGHPCDMNRLKAICATHSVYLIEDAAMSFGNTYEGKPLGTIGDFGVISFDITKQISAVQGGLLIVNNEQFKQRAGHIYHIGTNREDFMEGNAPYYEWVDVGSKFQMNELNAVALFDQLGTVDTILKHRQQLSKVYFDSLCVLEEERKCAFINVELMHQNYHEFYIITATLTERQKLTCYLKENNIEAMFHYVALNKTSKGAQFVKSSYQFTEKTSDCLLRLPLHNQLTMEEVQYVCQTIKDFFDVK